MKTNIWSFECLDIVFPFNLESIVQVIKHGLHQDWILPVHRNDWASQGPERQIQWRRDFCKKLDFVEDRNGLDN